MDLQAAVEAPALCRTKGNDRVTLDDARAAHPGFGFALYAITPGEPVTLEVIALDGQIFSFTGPTEQAVLDLAFPPAPPPNVFD